MPFCFITHWCLIIFFSFGKGYLIYPFRLYCNFQLISPCSLCDIVGNTWFFNYAKSIVKFLSRLGYASYILYSLARSIANHQKALLWCLTLPYIDFKLAPWSGLPCKCEKFDFALWVKSLIHNFLKVDQIYSKFDTGIRF